MPAGKRNWAGGRAEPILWEVLFPGRCLGCGQWLAFSGADGMPVCGSCRGGLVPLTGERCRVCSTPLISEEGICTRCRRTTYAFFANHSVFANAGCVKQLIGHYKLSGRTRLAALFAPSLRDALASRPPGIPLVPVPPHGGRRGPDPVEGLARALQKIQPLEILRLLRRTGGAAQKSLDYEQRRKNLQGMIRVVPGSRIPRRVVLLDDFFTTGATADACAGALRAAGCEEVSVLTLAIEI